MDDMKVERLVDMLVVPMETLMEDSWVEYLVGQTENKMVAWTVDGMVVMKADLRVAEMVAPWDGQ